MPTDDFTLRLSGILEQAGFDAEARKHAKLIRHPLSDSMVKKIWKDGFFDLYQAEQHPETFRGCDYIFSFIGEGGRSARFVGCYKVGSYRPLSEMRAKFPANYPDQKIFNDPKDVYFNLEKTDILKSLQNRLVIQWKYRWQVWATKDAPVIAITQRIQFPGYENVHLTYQELNEIIQEQSSEWFNALSKVCGVYLITTPKGLYVGSASGEKGIWGRWATYAKTGHANNELLTKLLEKNPGMVKEFRYSLLKVFPTRTISEDVIHWESHFKNILHTRNSSWGLNEN